MCGIAGIISINPNLVSRDRLKQMTDTIQHRGPEGEGFYINPNGLAGLGHRRLSIIDLSDAGAQPMHYQQRFTITYNGEIYNYIELKEQLTNKGYTFSSHCDTEIILAAYACWGSSCVDRFDGMFAFALWDEQEQTLFCARDRFGEKPFYFYHDQQQFVFASEMKAIKAAGLTATLNHTMLLNYITLGFTSNPADNSATFYTNFFKLPAAHCLQLQIKNDSISFKTWQYWDIDKETIDTTSTEQQLTDRFNQLFEQSIKLRLRSDVAIGSSLSGGLDSSAIVATINRFIDNDKQKVFSAVFPGFEKDESKYIKMITDAFNVESYSTTPTADGFIQDLEKILYHQEEPVQSSSIYAQYKVYELAKQHQVTVILDGQGADEILAGYHKYYHWYWQQLLSEKQWKKYQSEKAAAVNNGVNIDWSFKNYLAAFMPGLTAKQLQQKALHQQKQHQYLTSDFLHHTDKHSLYKPVVDKLNDILYFNTLQSGLEDLLRYADRNSMAHSREVRLPFLNHELVQFIFSLPAHIKINKGFTKYLLRVSMQKILPADIVWRKDKIGYEPPQQQWMQQPTMIEAINESRKKLVQSGMLKPSVLQQPIKPQAAHEAGNEDWRYLCTAYLL